MIRILPEAFVSIALIVRLILKKPNWLGTLFRGIPGAMAIYCLVCLATTAWSVNAVWTAYKSLEFLADVSLLAAIVASAEGCFTYKRLVDWTLTFYGLSLLGVWSNLPIWPTEAMDGGRLTGVVPVEASNSVGTSGAVLAIIALCRLMPVFGEVKQSRLVHAAAGIWPGLDGAVEDQKLGSGVYLRGGADCGLVAASAEDSDVGQLGRCTAGGGSDSVE